MLVKKCQKNCSVGGLGTFHFIFPGSFPRTSCKKSAWQVRQFDFSPCWTLIAGYGEGEMAKCVHEQQKLDGS